MGCWDELCLICGLCPGGGPSMLFVDLERTLDRIMEGLEEQDLDLDLDDDQLREEIRKVLLLFDDDGDEVDGKNCTRYERALRDGSIIPVHYFPLKSEESWDGWGVIAIGCFDETGNGQPVNGSVVTTRLVSCRSGYGGLFERMDGQGDNIRTDASAHTPNFFCLRTPYRYLQSWIDRDSLPPRQTALPLEPDMSFEGEFYELIDSSTERSTRGLAWIDYEGIECSLKQFQDDFTGAWSGAYELGEALQSGLRGNDLIPPLLRDFNVWQTCPPDRWIRADLSYSPSTNLQIPNQPTVAGHWGKLPTEIVLEVLSDLPLNELLSFASIFRYFYHKFGDSNFLSSLLRIQMRRPLSDTHWFMPVATVKGEVGKFCAACNESKSSEIGVTISKSAEGYVTFGAGFPLFEFFRTNFNTDSMKNRKRLWRISQQFRDEWYTYRTEELALESGSAESSDDSEEAEERSGEDDLILVRELYGPASTGA
ncbi:hypothetical protein CPB86DRAFT_83551 [Serendipita vermifera]|nr:hypothetical protein CPB86DRAFT_83551 [Serendipita vermifera]